MSQSNRSSRRGKRRQPVRYQEEEETVDDLAYAASFAMMGPPTTKSSVVPNGMGEDSAPNDDDGDDNDKGDEDIDIESDSSDGDSESDDDDNLEKAEDRKAEVNPKDENDEDDDDDEEEDHEELVKAIAAMEEYVTEEEAGISKASHKTQHEVDAYNTPIQELEQHLHFRLSVDDINQTRPRQLQVSDLKCAGTIKHHMAEDRTIVIESNPPVRGASLNPLDEGTLLLIKGEELSSFTSIDNKNSNQSMIPLGRIFETFGPVTRPLYTIRLPETIVASKPTVEKDSAQEATPSNGNSEPTVDTNDSKETDDNDQKSEDGSKEIHKKKENDTTTSRLVDDWGPNGKYSQLVQRKGSSGVAVYFLEDEAKLIDTDMILKKSGKGCDASNLYDEEINNKEEMYYSDDEKERQAKSRRKDSRNQQSRQPPQHQQGGSQPTGPRGFHQAPNPTGFHAPTANMLPQGFHQPPAVYGHPLPSAPYQQYPNYGHPPGANPPPPPPPTPGQGKRHQAPNNSGPPPAYQY